MTELLAQKIAALRNIIEVQKMERFQHELMLEDTAEPTGNERSDAALRAQAEISKAIIAQCTRRIAVRMPILEKYEAEQRAENEKTKKETGAIVAAEPQLSGG